LFYLSPENGTL